MNNNIHPLIGVSRCLGFASCRYNGEIIHDETVDALRNIAEFIPLCPEADIGLGIPRDPIRMIEEKGITRLIQPSTGRDVTPEMTAYAEKSAVTFASCDGIIMKCGSPSCGPTNVKIHEGSQKGGRSHKGAGLFADSIAHALPHIIIEDEGRLRNFIIREHFYTAVFAQARFRQSAAEKSIGALMEFHTVNKLLLLSYNQSVMREMGKLLAAARDAEIDQTAETYRNLLHRAFANPPKPGAIINVLEHALGGFKNVLTPDEKKLFLSAVDEYHDERIPLSAVLYILKAWSVVHANSYILGQSFMEPFPRELMIITDSGKGRSF